jgi:hypothetical protein
MTAVFSAVIFCSRYIITAMSSAVTFSRYIITAMFSIIFFSNNVHVFCIKNKKTPFLLRREVSWTIFF